jgi:hypothetical protein
MPPARRSVLLCLAALVAAGAAAPLPARAQPTPAQLHVLRLESTPVGALPRMALPMPASRDHHYWGVRVQTGYRGGRGDKDLLTLAGGVDLQWRGGSVIGATVGHQARDCALLGPDCGGHALFGLRSRFNLMTGSSRIGEALGDYSANAKLGAELGLGYAPEYVPGSAACTADLGLPFSIALLQKVRVVTYVTPGVVWEIDCSGEPLAERATYLLGGGVGLQQLGHRGLDFYLGWQKFLRSASGYQFGLSVTYTLLP